MNIVRWATTGLTKDRIQSDGPAYVHGLPARRIPGGRPLRTFAGREDAKYFRPHNDVVDATYGSFFVVFDRH
jgi:hypothetical protein